MKVYRDADIKSYVDERGVIKTLESVLDPNATIRGVLSIKCNAGAVRAEHYHRRDTHWAFVCYGQLVYSECPVGEDGKPDKSKLATVELSEGDMVFTPAGFWHRMDFPVDSQFIAFTTEPRDQGAYEDDTVRVKLE